MDRRTDRSNALNKKQSDGEKKSSDGEKKREIDKKMIIFVLLALLLILGAFYVLRNVYFFITESGEDPDNPYPVKGIDVSAHQEHVDWKGLEDEGIRFAFIKATEGTTFVDSLFEYNWKHAHRTSMKVGAYHFLSYTTPGKTQAENYIETVNKKWGMLPPVVDVEFYGEYLDAPPTKNEMYAILDVVLEELEEEYNRVPIIYTNLHIYNKYIAGRYDKYPIWISSPDGIPETLPDEKDWLFCQYTFTGTTPSIGNNTKHVDYNVFNGTGWEFRKYNGK